MKAIVAEIDKKQMIVITDKGDFIKVKRQMSVGIGDEIELKPQKISMNYRRLASIAACFLACIFMSTGVYAYYTPYSYVSVDINPSIAMSLNRFDRVISVEPLTEDAVGLLKETKDLKNQDIDKALSTIIKSASEKGYIDEKAENQVMVVVSAKDQKQEEKLASAVNTTAAKELAKVNKSSEVMVEKTSVKNYKEAVAHKVSPGKEILADKLREVNPEVKDEEVRDMSVKEAVQRIKEGRKAAMEAEKDKNRDDREKNNSNSRDKNEKDDKAAAKAEGKDDRDRKNGEKPKPSAAAGKDDKDKYWNSSNKGAAASDKNNDGKSRQGDGPAAGADKDDEDDEDRDKDKGKSNSRPGGVRDNNGSNGPGKGGNDDKDSKDKYRDDDKDGKDKDRESDKGKNEGKGRD